MTPKSRTSYPFEDKQQVLLSHLKLQNSGRDTFDITDNIGNKCQVYDTVPASVVDLEVSLGMHLADEYDAVPSYANRWVTPS